MSGVFSRVAPKLILISRGSEARLSIISAVVVAASSAIIMNDTAMFIFIPLLVTISRIAGINRSRLVVTAAIAANVGSALTPIGNPQNIIIWRNYGVPFHEFIAGMTPYVIGWVGLLALFVGLTCRGGEVSAPVMPKVRVKKGLLAASTALLAVDVALSQLNHPFIALALTIATLSVIGREAVKSLDIALIAVFTLIFIDFKEVASLLIAAGAHIPTGSSLIVTASSALISQLISNVPATVLMTSLTPKPSWLPLSVGVNVGGTGLIIGSLANFIAARLAGVGIREFHKYSLPYFTAALGLTLLRYVV